MQLQDLLTTRELEEEHLPEMKKTLEGYAKTALSSKVMLIICYFYNSHLMPIILDKGHKSNWPIESLQRDLEGISATINNIKKREMRFAGLSYLFIIRI